MIYSGRKLMVKLAIPKWVIALLVVSAISGTVLALQMFGQINISYVIQPTSQPPTLTPNPIQLDLGTINSGATGTKDLGYAGEMTLPDNYEVTFELDTATIEDFAELIVYIEVREYSTGNSVTTICLGLGGSYSDSYLFNEGVYNLYVSVYYTAKSVTSTTSGTINISISFPG